ncbi:hypothetical protein GCM10027037_13360 [Mucilaginibacter koreensis]
MYSALEITDKEFLIKLDRSKFNINLIRTLLKIVEVSNPSDVEERIDHRMELNKSNSLEPDYFGNLEEK